MKVDLSVEELNSLLLEQLEFIESSCTGYDNGFRGEIKRLAVATRVLVHDTDKSTSLLKLLDKKNVQFFDTFVPYDEQNLLSHSSLVVTILSSRGAGPAPVLDDGPFSRFIGFDAWWNGIVFVDSKRNEFSRKDIFLSLANKEGGAHVDKQLDQKYADLRKNNSLGWFVGTIGGKELSSADQVPATMRQIAHELLRTLKNGYSCRRKTESNDGIYMLGASIVQRSSPPPIPDHNIPKNRPIVSGRRIGRNDPCPCGSGRKYKKCCIS
jgi:hypothetical protein